MGFFKDYKDETANTAESLTEEDILAIEDILDGSLQDIEGAGDMAGDFDDEVDEDLLNSLLTDEPQEEFRIQEETEAAVESKATIIEPVKEVRTEVKPEVKPEVKHEISEEDKRAVTVITKGTTINGSIISDCSLDVMGTINGDVECLGKLTISGKVVGNSTASEIFVNTKRLEGNINSEGTIKIGLGTVVIGDINAVSGVIAGAVKGEIDIDGPVVIDSTAIIKGNIKAQSIQMNNGAVLEGFCSLSHAAVDIDNIFE